MRIPNVPYPINSYAPERFGQPADLAVEDVLEDGKTREER
jgi:hypothetical protein